MPQRKQRVVDKLFWQACPFYTWGRRRRGGRTGRWVGGSVVEGGSSGNNANKWGRTGWRESGGGHGGTQENKWGHDCEAGRMAGWFRGRPCHWLAELEACRVHGWQTGFLTNRLACWFSGRLHGGLTGWRGAWRVQRLAGCLCGWLAGCLCIHYSSSVSDDVGQAQF